MSIDDDWTRLKHSVYLMRRFKRNFLKQMAHKFEEKRNSILQQMDMNLEWVLNIFSWNRLGLNLKSGYFNQVSIRKSNKQLLAHKKSNM